MEILHYCKTNEVDSTAILSLDPEKALDRVEHSYILTLLNHMNFGPKFRTALQMAYQHSQAIVKVNGSMSSRFGISRGTRQGCPLSPLLFALAIEPLAEALRRKEDYRGIQIRKQEFKLSLFADDLVLYLKHPQPSLQCIEELLSKFQTVSGLNINMDKSLLYPICMKQTESDTLRASTKHKWVSHCWKYLGVQFPLNFKAFLKVNLETVDCSVTSTLRSWTDKQLSWSRESK